MTEPGTVLSYQLLIPYYSLRKVIHSFFRNYSSSVMGWTGVLSRVYYLPLSCVHWVQSRSRKWISTHTNQLCFGSNTCVAYQFGFIPSPATSSCLRAEVQGLTRCILGSYLWLQGGCCGGATCKYTKKNLGAIRRNMLVETAILSRPSGWDEAVFCRWSKRTFASGEHSWQTAGESPLLAWNSHSISFAMFSLFHSHSPSHTYAFFVSIMLVWLVLIPSPPFAV